MKQVSSIAHFLFAKYIKIDIEIVEIEIEIDAEIETERQIYLDR